MAAAVGSIPAFLGIGLFADRLPGVLLETRVLGLWLWQWIGLAILVVGGALAGWLLTAVLLRIAAPMIDRGPDDVSPIAPTLVAPLRLAVWLGICVVGSALLDLDPVAHAWLGHVALVIGIALAGWVALRLVDRLGALGRAALERRGQLGATGVVPVVTRIAKGVIAALAVLLWLQNLGVNVTSVVAGLGIGGIAVALAAQKTLENLFGGVMLLVDQPVRVGEFCRFGAQVGTVEEVGLRSTRIRTLDRTIVSMPNAQFATMPLENFTRRDRIRLTAVLGLRYETTPDQLRCVLIEAKRLLLAHPKVAAEPARIRLVGFGAYSLDLEIFAYVLTTDYDEFLAVREDLMLRLMDILAANGTGFAFPSQTVYARRDPGLDEARRRAAEERVRTWRTEGRLWLPEVPADVATAVEDTLDYPPEGSAARARRVDGHTGGR